jgi:hypothetical protein
MLNMGLLVSPSISHTHRRTLGWIHLMSQDEDISILYLLAARIPAFIPSRKSVEPIGVIGGMGQIGTMTISPFTVL